MLFYEFQDGRYSNHLKYRNRTTLAILNLHVASNHVSAQYDIDSGDVFLNNFNMAVIFDIETDDFDNSKSPCDPNASQQVWAKSDVGFGSGCGLPDVVYQSVAAILNIGTERF